MNHADQVIDQALRILQRKPIDGYEIYFSQSSHFDVESKDGKIETLDTSRYLGMAFRILNHQRMGFSYTTFSNPSPSIGQNFSNKLDQMIEDAIGSSKTTSPDPCFDFAPFLNDPPPQLHIFDETLEKISEKEKIEKAKYLEEAARSVDSERIKKVRKASYQEVLSKTTLINSNGFQFSCDHTLTSISLTAVAEESGESERGWICTAAN